MSSKNDLVDITIKTAKANGIQRVKINRIENKTKFIDSKSDPIPINTTLVNSLKGGLIEIVNNLDKYSQYIAYLSTDKTLFITLR